MVEFTLKGGDEIMKRLEDISRSMGGGTVSIGFMEEAKYPDGTPVAQVAYWNEFGTSKIPARPFFRQMIAQESPSWGDKMAVAAKETGLNAKKTLGIMGEDIKGALEQSIRDMDTPPNAPSTIRSKGFNDPLIDTGHMEKSVNAIVEVPK